MLDERVITAFVIRSASAVRQKSRYGNRSLGREKKRDWLLQGNAKNWEEPPAYSGQSSSFRDQFV